MPKPVIALVVDLEPVATVTSVVATLEALKAVPRVVLVAVTLEPEATVFGVQLKLRTPSETDALQAAAVP